jgi:hypothetical protein
MQSDMLTVSFLMSDDINEKMQIHKQNNWSGIFRQQIADRERRDVVHTVATSERLSQERDEYNVTARKTPAVMTGTQRHE